MGRSIDPSRASITRVYDAVLGGKDNYEADRKIRDRLLAVAPDFGTAAWDSRHFLVRAVRFLAGRAGISQFLDCGACLPIGESTHEVAQRLRREASVVYVTRDPLVLAYDRALMADNDRTHVADVDLRYPRQVFDHPAVRGHLNLEQPLAVCHVGTLHHVPDRDDPWRIMGEYVDMVPSGSYFVLAHLVDPGPDGELTDLAAGVLEVYRSGLGSGWFRSPDRIRDLLPGLELLEPGLVHLPDWWPDGPWTQPLSAMQRLVLGAVARKP